MLQMEEVEVGSRRRRLGSNRWILGDRRWRERLGRWGMGSCKLLGWFRLDCRSSFFLVSTIARLQANADCVFVISNWPSIVDIQKIAHFDIIYFRS